MPPLDEGDLLYMPTALPGLAVGKAAEILQQTDRILKTFPEVQRVFGKIGRAESATDPAPLEMMETTLVLKPKSQWRRGSHHGAASSRRWMPRCRFPAWRTCGCNRSAIASTCSPPASNRRSGSKSPGPTLRVIERVGRDIEAAVRTVPGTASAFAERVSGGRYIEIVPDRGRIARYGLSIADVQRIVSVAIGGENVGETVEGLQRFPINVRYPRELRDSVQDLRTLPIVTARGETLTLGDDRECRDHGRSADDQERKRAPQRLDLRGHPRARSRRLRCGRQTAPLPIWSYCPRVTR